MRDCLNILSGLLKLFILWHYVTVHTSCNLNFLNSYFLNFYFLFLCVWVFCLHDISVPLLCNAYGDQKKALDSVGTGVMDNC